MTLTHSETMAMRQRAKRYGFTVSKSRAKLPLAVDFGQWTVTHRGSVVLTTTDPCDIVAFLADADAVQAARS